MADYSLFRQEYKLYIATFKETSFDSHNNYFLCTDESIETINFDKIVEEKYPDSNKRPQSFDSLYLDKDNNTIYLVEFKNEKKPEKKEVEGKLLDGKKELISLLNDLKISTKEYKFIFCLVYNKFKPKHERHKRGLFKSMTFEFLNKYKENGFIDDIYTEDVNFFTKQFQKKTSKELKC
ncbi:MAG: hypothetical protein U9O64_01325 [Campylobacterota bacterium]|nr:hypothetical protein [Campylobacterota bacterium]